MEPLSPYAFPIVGSLVLFTGLTVFGGSVILLFWWLFAVEMAKPMYDFELPPTRAERKRDEELEDQLFAMSMYQSMD